MKRSRSIAVMLMLLSAGCASHIDLSREQTALLETDRAWAAAAAGDIPRLTSFWADDAVNFFPGAPVARGKDEIRKLVQQNRSKPGFSLSWKPVESTVADAGDLGYTLGSFQLSSDTADGNPMVKRGNYLCIWKKQPDGGWKCVVERTIFSE